MKRKKFFAVLLASVLCFCLCFAVACAQTEPPTGNDVESSGPVQQPNDSEDPDKSEQDKEVNKMYLTINGNKLEVTLEENSATAALVELLKQGNITYTANDYGNFEKVGDLGHSLPHKDTQIKTEPGDVILYQGNQIVLFYGNNSWSYTRIGKINGYSASELRNLLGAGKGTVEVTISLT